MKNEIGPHRLLDDVLAEIAPLAFRAELLERVVKQARRRNRIRQLNQGLFAIAVVAIAGLLAWKTQVRQNVGLKPFFAALNEISSKPLDPSMVVANVPGSVDIISSIHAAVVVVETQSSTHDYRELNDEELLALMAGTPSVLVRQGPHQAELLVVDVSTQIARPVDETYERQVPAH